MLGSEGSAHVAAIDLVLEPLTRLTNLPGQWLQCQTNGSNVCRVLRGGAPSDRERDGGPEEEECYRDSPALQGYLAHKKQPPPLGPT